MSPNTQKRAPETGYAPERAGNPFVSSTKGGRVLSAMMLPLLLLSPSDTFGVITTTGRRTGKTRRKCVRAVRHGNRVYLVSIPGEHAAWLKNIRANASVELRLRGGTFHGLARDPRDAEERDLARRIFCETIDPLDRVACALHRRGRPSRQKVKALHHKWFDRGTPLVVELE